MRKATFVAMAMVASTTSITASAQMAPRGGATDDGKTDKPGHATTASTDAQLRATIEKQRKYIVALEKRVKTLEAQLAQRP